MTSPTRIRVLLFVVAIGLLSGLALAQPPEIPPFDPTVKPGDPPPVPGYETPTPAENPSLPPPNRVPLPDTPTNANEPEVLGRGPIHEGFAQPGANVTQPGPVVPRQPPEPIEEIPPDQRPEGDNVAWIPGYWSWDEERNDFVWVSGFWRVVPPGRKWVPGYWTRADGGYRWVSGAWVDAAQPEVPYADTPPPESLDVGPSIPPLEEDSIYVPGSWIYAGRWQWQPGFWCPPRIGWVYCPPRVCWTPRGFLFTAGYWDRCLATRGVLFAPVWCPPRLLARPGFVFRPAFAVPHSALLGALWIGPGRRHYAFGDFYARRYLDRGFQPWAVAGPRLRDPLFLHYAALNRNNPAWQRGLVSTYEGRLRGTVAVPPRTLAAQQQLLARDRQTPQVVTALNSYRNDRLPLTRVAVSERQESNRLLNNYRQAIAERQRVETRPATGLRRPESLSLQRLPTPSAPVAGRPATTATTRPQNPRPSTSLRPSTPTQLTPTVPRPDLARPSPTQPSVTRPTPTVPRPDLARPSPTRPAPVTPRPQGPQPTPTPPTRPSVVNPTRPSPVVPQPTRPTLPGRDSPLVRPSPSSPPTMTTRPTMPMPSSPRPTPSIPRPSTPSPTYTPRPAMPSPSYTPRPSMPSPSYTPRPSAPSMSPAPSRGGAPPARG